MCECLENWGLVHRRELIPYVAGGFEGGRMPRKYLKR